MASEKSSSERYFEYWLDELKEEGFVKNYIREHKTYVLADKRTYFKERKLKTKTLLEEKTLFNHITYTPDYYIEFTERALKYFIHETPFEEKDTIPNEKGELKSLLFFNSKLRVEGENIYTVLVDVKPPASAIRFSGSLGSSREFPIKQRMMFDVHNLYVNKIVPTGTKNSLFYETFLPKRYKLTDRTKKPRKLSEIELKCKSLKEFLNYVIYRE